MYKLYYLVSTSTHKYYIGITRQSLYQRFHGHLYSMKSGNPLPLYCAMRKYRDFCIVLIEEFNSEKDMLNAEIIYIKEVVENNHSIYNMTTGGESGFKKEMVNKEEWIDKLRKGRSGRKPFLGCKHSDKNKQVFSKSSLRRWDIYGRYPEDVINLSFKEAYKLYGISKTHYYRLKRAKSNELS